MATNAPCRRGVRTGKERSCGDLASGLVTTASHPHPVALGAVQGQVEGKAILRVLAHLPFEVRRLQHAPGQNLRGRHEEERRQTLAAGARIGPRIGKDQALGRLGDRPVKEAAGLEQAVLGGGEPRARSVVGFAFDFCEQGELGGFARSSPRSRGARSGGGARGGERLALGIEQKRIRSEHARVSAFDQPRDRDEAERYAGHRIEGAHVDGSARARLQGQPLVFEAPLQDLFDIPPVHPRGERPERGEVGHDLRHLLSLRLPAWLGLDPEVEDLLKVLRPFGPRGEAVEAVEGLAQELHHPQQRVRVAGPSQTLLAPAQVRVRFRGRALLTGEMPQPRHPAMEIRDDLGVSTDTVPLRGLRDGVLAEEGRERDPGKGQELHDRRPFEASAPEEQQHRPRRASDPQRHRRVEPVGDPEAGEQVGEERRVQVRPRQDRSHLLEGHSPSRLFEHPPDDGPNLGGFTGRAQKLDRRILHGGARGRLEERKAQLRECRGR